MHQPYRVDQTLVEEFIETKVHRIWQDDPVLCEVLATHYLAGPRQELEMRHLDKKVWVNPTEPDATYFQLLEIACEKVVYELVAELSRLAAERQARQFVFMSRRMAQTAFAQQRTSEGEFLLSVDLHFFVVMYGSER